MRSFHSEPSLSSEVLKKLFLEALDEIVEEVKKDRSILAVILCGSLSHDTVWAKSDIDLALVTIDDKNIQPSHVSLNSKGLNVHAFLMPRAEFRKSVEGAIRNSFMHSLMAKGKLLYTHDETIVDLCARFQEIGDRDSQLQLLAAATQALAPVDKAHKWMVTRGDPDYASLWILYAASPLARIEVISARQLAGREVILQAMVLNPEFFRTIYTAMLNGKKSRKNVQDALDAVDGYLAERAVALFAPVLEHMREAGEARSSTEIESHFKRNFNIEGTSAACEYLADQGLLSKVSTPVQLTKRSNVMLQEQAFVYIEGLHG